MRLMTRPFPNLIYADMIPYYWEPRFYFRWHKRGRTTWDEEGNPHWSSWIAGVHCRIWPIGFVLCWPDVGWFRNGSRWQVFYWYDKQDELLGM